MRALALSLLFLIVSLPTVIATAAPLPDFEASYKLEQHGLRMGTARITFRTNTQGQYLYEFHSQPNRWIAWFTDKQLKESSRGMLAENGIRPDQYHYHRSGDKQREADLSFNWQSMTVENHVAGSHWEMDIPAGTLDKLASLLGIMIALGQGNQDVTFNVADGGALKKYRYRVIGRETLDVPAGTFSTVKVARLRTDIDQETILWFAPELHYLPIRIWRRDSDNEQYQSDLETFSRSLWGKKSRR